MCAASPVIFGMDGLCLNAFLALALSNIYWHGLQWSNVPVPVPVLFTIETPHYSIALHEHTCNAYVLF